MSFQSPNPTSLATDDPNAPAVAAVCFEFLLIELVPMAYRIAAEVAAREDEWLAGGHAGEKKEGAKEEEKVRKRDEMLVKGFGIGGIGGTVEGREEEETKEGVFWKLDGLGYRVGLGLVER
jgi:trafficking protein particle complex subunit 6